MPLALEDSSVPTATTMDNIGVKRMTATQISAVKETAEMQIPAAAQPEYDKQESRSKVTSTAIADSTNGGIYESTAKRELMIDDNISDDDGAVFIQRSPNMEDATTGYPQIELQDAPSVITATPMASSPAGFHHWSKLPTELKVEVVKFTLDPYKHREEYSKERLLILLSLLLASKDMKDLAELSRYSRRFEIYGSVFENFPPDHMTQNMTRISIIIPELSIWESYMMSATHLPIWGIVLRRSMSKYEQVLAEWDEYFGNARDSRDSEFESETTRLLGHNASSFQDKFPKVKSVVINIHLDGRYRGAFAIPCPLSATDLRPLEATLRGLESAINCKVTVKVHLVKRFIGKHTLDDFHNNCGCAEMIAKIYQSAFDRTPAVVTAANTDML